MLTPKHTAYRTYAYINIVNILLTSKTVVDNYQTVSSNNYSKLSYIYGVKPSVKPKITKMKKTTLVNYLLYGYDNSMNSARLNEIKAKLDVFVENNAEKPLAEFTNDLKFNFPQLEILHDTFIRSKTSKIESHLKTIKNIVIVLLIISIIGAVILAIGSGSI